MNQYAGVFIDDDVKDSFLLEKATEMVEQIRSDRYGFEDETHTAKLGLKAIMLCLRDRIPNTSP